MAEQSSHDVVNQSRSGGDSLPSDVPASKPDKNTTGGDGEDKQTLNKDLKDNTESSVSQEKREEDKSTQIVQQFDERVPTKDDTDTFGIGLPAHDESARKQLEVNGIESVSSFDDDGTTHTQHGDGSGGSDTDASRGDLRSLSKESTQHSRTSSVKRPATFKPVSWAKYSISKSPGVATASKATTEQAPFSLSNGTNTPTQHSSRPRLVAKSTSSMRDSTPRALGGGGKNGAGGPNPNQVWNKNRPVQTPPTKHLTDEELKQQYGIHMTSRIQTDADDKEAKWADIDDDEDDWAPETIEWNDGTKVTLTQTENPPVPIQAKIDVPDRMTTQPTGPLDRISGMAPSKVPTSKPPGSLGPNATILKLGASVERQQARLGVDSKAVNDKNGSVLKTPLPPAKSPWAPLPPIEKVSPAAIPPPAQPPRSSRFFQGAPQDSIPPLPGAKEIAADDFNRSWRDRAQPTSPRELFNSQSGRYEAVSDPRRGQYGNDAHFRPASLLQRQDNLGPAEPSPAFQTHRSSQEAGSWTRRRASSNVSGGSGVMGRRLSMSKPDLSHRTHDIPPPRRGSQQHEQLPQPGAYVPRGPSPSRPPATITSSQTQPSPYSPSASHAGTVQTPVADPALTQVPAMEDTIAMQQRIMREKRDMARQRRLEEEAKEEAAKQERIRIKLEAMGPPPSEKSHLKEHTAPQEPPKQPMVVSSPPKPPVLDPSGEPKQYGLMKVHPPEPVIVAPSEKSMPPSHMSPLRESKFEQSRSTAPPPSVNGVRPSNDVSAVTKPESNHGPVNDRNPTWKGSGPANSSYSSWSGAKAAPHATSSNLWGSPNNDKALGNGTFDKNLTGFPSRDLQSHAPLPPAEHSPIGSSQATAQASMEKNAAPERAHQRLPRPPKQMADNSSSLSPLASPEARPGRPHGTDHMRPVPRPGPIAPPPNYNQGQRWQHNQYPRRSEETAAWNNFHNVAKKAEMEENERFHRELRAKREEEVRTGIKPALQVTFNETWRQVRTGDDPGQRNIVSVTKTAEQAAPLPLHNLETTRDGLSFADSKFGTTARGSRFFPHGSDQIKRPLDRDNYEGQTPSPPPPDDISTHPVFTCDSARPLVHLPAPKPRVKLPPQSSPPAPPPASFASMVAGPPPPRGSQPIASTATWQDRFNGLFGRKLAPAPQMVQPSPVKKTALAVASATKEPLEVLPSISSAAVSLPQFGDTVVFDRDAGKTTSKEVEDEEAIFEDREAGSLPVVNVPHMAPKAAWQPALPPSQQRLRSRYQKPVQAQSIEPYIFSSDDRGNAGALIVTIRFPGNPTPKTVAIPGTGGTSSGSTHPHPHPRHRHQNHRNHRRGGRSGREGPSHHAPHSAKKTQPTVPGGPRSRHGSSNWAPRVASATT